MKNALKLLPLALIMAVHFSLSAGPRDEAWRSVNDAVQKGLPKTAITNLEPIIAAALRDKAYPEAAKAIAKKIALEGTIQGNKPEERIVRLEAEMARAPKEMTPVLETVLAEWYWRYFQANRYRFMQRTAVAQMPPTLNAPSGVRRGGAAAGTAILSQTPADDFTTWDLPRLFAEIDKHFQASLAAEKILKATPIAAWDDLIERGTMPDSNRPTLYDFLAHEALDFYTSGEQAAAKPEDAFELSADGPIFRSVSELLEWVDRFDGPDGAKLVGDTNAPGVKALRLYRDLLRFHQGDPAPRLAFAAADLDRLEWGWNTAFGEEKNAAYKAALEAFIRANGDFDISALALEREARVLQQEGDLAAAHELAARGAKLFPTSPGGKLCQNLVNEIEAKSAGISTERVWNAPWPKITVRYANVGAVYFRAIPVDWAQFLERRNPRPENLTQQQRREYLAKTPALTWSAKLPPTPDYKERTFDVPAPEKLKPGYYFIAASHDENFLSTDNMVSMTDVWVSDLAMITRTRAGNIEGFLTEANSGEPVVGAAVSVWYLDNNGNRVVEPDLATDTNGFFSMKPTQNRGYLFLAKNNGQELATAQDLYWYQGQPAEPRPRASTVFFTDRAIYRPGQTIQYKGICLWIDQAQDNYETLKGEQVTVVFRDMNGKEIARQSQRANDYGSFSGSFTAPRDRVMGNMTLRTEGRANGFVNFRVEEYKRPKFEVSLDAPKTAPKLNDTVSLTGHAMAYTGAAVDSAVVQYRVVREVRMPWWWGWYGRGMQGESQDIAHGTARTGTDGSFTIEFTAKPDPKVLEKDEPTFNYQINADVTDSSGETRSADRAVRVGYTALEAMLSADDWQTGDKPVELKIETKTLDGEPQAAEGSVKIYELQPPEKVQRAPLGQRYFYTRFGSPGMGGGDEADMSNPNNWPLGKVALERPFSTGTNGETKLLLTLGAGVYRAMLETQDRFGKHVTGRLPLQVVQLDAAKFAIKIPHLLDAPKWEAQPGDEFMALWGTGYDEGRAFVEIEQRNKIIQSFWTQPGRTQQQIKLAVTEAMRGGFELHVTQVRENRAYIESRKISVPWKNKELAVTWEHFTSKLQPGQKETWTAVVTGPGAERSAAEMVAALYDESLDAFAARNWQHGFGVFREDNSNMQEQFLNYASQFNQVYGNWNRPMQGVEISYRHFPADLVANLWNMRVFGGFGGGGGRGGRGGGVGGVPMAMAADSFVERAEEAPSFSGMPMAAAMPAPAAPAMMARTAMMPSDAIDRKSISNGPMDGAGNGSAQSSSSSGIDLSTVSARQNLNETAFFYPQLMSDSNGVVRMTFTMPEALTKWRFLAFAHDQKLRAGFLEGHAVTSKDIMVQPNPPRFLREGDTVEFTVKVSNQSDKEQSGRVQLTFNDMSDGKSADKLLGNAKPEQPFAIPAKESRSFSWRVTVPDGAPFLSYKAVAATSALSDGEEGGLPVLSRRILVTESLPLPIRGPATNKFEFQKLADSGKSKTLQSQSLTVQMVSNPSWYAVLALPYLMEYPYECSEATFNRFYANALAQNIANRDPKIRAVFEQWKNTPALDSPLEKNQDLKSVMIEETPWLRQAQSESQARRNVGILFDENRLTYEMDATLRKLTEMQLNDGRWPWFPGGQGSDYITLYIVTGFGRLRHLGLDLSPAPAVRALARLDAWMTEEYDYIQQHVAAPDQYVPNATDALYLYGRSFFLTDRPVAAPNKTAVEFFLKQSRKRWLQTDCRQSQGQLALALKRFGGAENLAAAQAIMRSLKERSVSNEEMGMFWRDTELSWWWYRAPIETQALMIEAFDEVMNDQPAVEDCRVWLLKQKQTQDWKTTKATADAVYALLLRGRDLLSSTALVDVSLGGIEVTPGTQGTQIRNPQLAAPKPGDGGSAIRNSPEPGTGFYEFRFAPADIKPGLGAITVKKTDQGVAWGAVYWQYLEDMSKVTPYEGTPLKLTKTLFTKVNSARGQTLEPVKGAVAVGDELVVRIELRVDRDMEYVHLKDQRGSGTEPVNVLSRYKYQDGLRYYESTRDTASHFFIDYLPKGTYVFEYSTRVQLRGQYQTGVAEIQCMYAPEFNSHSESLVLNVK